MSDLERCVVWVSNQAWLHDLDGSTLPTGFRTMSQGHAYAEFLGIPFRVVNVGTQAGFAKDVSIERFGLSRPSEGLWFTATTGTPVWARF